MKSTCLTGARMAPLATALFLAMAASVHAVEVQTWTQQTTSDFEEGTLDGVVVTSDGKLVLAHQLAALSDLSVVHVWAIAREADGSLIAATGGPGLVVRIAPDGTVSKLHESPDQQVFAVALDKDGSLYYGLSPNGQIFRRTKEGNVETFFETEETYIWGLAVLPEGGIMAATGPQGRLYKVGSDGKGQIFFQARQKHLLSMALGPNDTTYVGTSNDGLIYRIDADGKGFVLHDAPQADVHALLLDEKGRLFAGTGTPERPTFPVGQRRSSSPLGLLFPATALTFLGPLAPVADAPAPAPAPNPSRAAPRPSLAASGENSVFMIAPDGQVDEVFREKCLVLSLALQGDHLLIGTGQEGRLYLVNPATRVRQTLARLESGQIQSMVTEPNGSVVLGTGAPGKVWSVASRFGARGTMESSVFDAKMQTRWGRGVWQGEVPTGAKLAVDFRAGNVEKPDQTWSSWAADSSTLPLSRFLQYRVTMEAPDGQQSPELAGVSVYYATINRPPTVDSVEVPNLASKPISDAAAKIEIRWKATDPNGDTLTFDLDVRKEGWPEWVAVAREQTGSDFKWDPGSMPSGNYRFRVTASDAPSNRQGDTLKQSLESTSFTLDRDPPAVTITSAKQVGKHIEVFATGKDAQTRLTAAAYSLNGMDWWPLFPDDGIFDSLEEAITFHTGELEPQSYLLMVRFRDSAGHLGVADSVIRIE